MTDDTLMTLSELADAINAMAAALGPDTQVSVDIDFSASRRRRRVTWGSLYVMECQLERIPHDTVSTETPEENHA